jgi:hypothetical protein
MRRFKLKVVKMEDTGIKLFGSSLHVVKSYKDVEIEIIPNKTPLAGSEEAEAMAEAIAVYDEFYETTVRNKESTAPSLKTLLQYMKLRKKIYQTKEAAARALMQYANQTDQEQFENVQAYRDSGWLYYYLIKYHILILKTRAAIPAEFTNIFKSLQVHQFALYHNEMMIQQECEHLLCGKALNGNKKY